MPWLNVNLTCVDVKPPYAFLCFVNHLTIGITLLIGAYLSLVNRASRAYDVISISAEGALCCLVVEVVSRCQYIKSSGKILLHQTLQKLVHAMYGNSFYVQKKNENFQFVDNL